MSNDDEELVARLRSLPLRRLVEVFYQAVAPSYSRREFSNDHFEIKGFSLAECIFGKFEGKLDARAELQLVALPAPEYAHLDWKSLSRSGVCTFCKSSVLSFVEGAVCPVCRSEVELD